MHWLQMLQAKGIKAQKVVIHDSFVSIHFKHSTEYVLRGYRGNYTPLGMVFQSYINESIPLKGNVLWWYGKGFFLEGIQL